MTWKRVLILSACLNVMLAGFMIWLSRQRAVEPAIIHQATGTTTQVAATDQPQAVSVIVDGPFHWSEVEAADYKVYLEKLRAIGCPEQTIRDIITADLDSYFDQRVKDLVDSVTGRFWEMIVNGETAEKEVEQKLQEVYGLEEERNAILASLFPEPDSSELEIREAEQLAQLKWQYDFLSDEKVAALQLINENTREDSKEWRRQNPNALDSDYQQWRSQMDLRREQQIQSLLTPEEYAEYQLRNSAVAQVRYRLADLDISEQEVRSIAMMATNSAGNSGIKDLLGPKRFAAYERAQDASYQQTVRITDRYDLPSEKAVEIYEMQRAATAQAEAIRADSQRTAEERQALLQEIQSETERSITAALGPKVFKTYQKYNGGWLSTLGQTQKAAE